MRGYVLHLLILWLIRCTLVVRTEIQECEVIPPKLQNITVGATETTMVWIWDRVASCANRRMEFKAKPSLNITFTWSSTSEGTLVYTTILMSNTTPNSIYIMNVTAVADEGYESAVLAILTSDST